MIFKIWNSFMSGREDAEAVDVEAQFSDFMDFIESDQLDSHSQECLAHAFVRLITKIGELAKAKRPAHLHDDIMIFLPPKELRREAENFEKQAKFNSKSDDSTRVLLGLTQKLVGIYLRSKSWAARPLPRGNLKAALHSPSVTRARIEERIAIFLAQFGKSIPR